MAKAIYFDTFSGISGDMMLGALLHAGLPFDHLQSELAKLGLTETYHLEIRSVQQHGITGIKLEVTLTEGEQPHRSISAIEQIISKSALNDRVRANALAIFHRLAEAEAKVHGISPQQVHFHEVGAVDAMVDIIGSCIGFNYFQIEEFYCGSLPTGTGFVRSAHGLIPIPAPATLELLTQAGATFAPAVTLPGGIEYPPRMEMVTPTGAAIVATLCRFERPAFKLTGSGYGYGSKQLPWPNALRVWLGETSTSTTSQPQHHQHQPEHHSHSHQSNHHQHNHQETSPSSSLIPHPSSLPTPDPQPLTPTQVSVLETNLDDMTPEGLGYLMEKLLAEGALDVYFTPIQMKKNRPATKLSVIVRPEDEARFASLVLQESSSFGLRCARMQRYIAEREFDEVEISAGKAKIKRKIVDGETVETAPEYESVAALARKSGRPWREIYDEVRLAALTQNKQPNSNHQA